MQKGNDVTQQTMTMRVRQVTPSVSVIEIAGDVTAASEAALTDAYARAGADATKAVMLDFTRLEYMNSGGIGLLVTLLVRANRQGQRLLAYGLTEHYRQILELTRLDEAISVHDTEADALAASEA